MELRDELFPDGLDEERVESLTALCEEIIDRVVYKGEEASDMIEAFNRRTGGDFGESDFCGVHGSRPAREFVEDVLTERPQPVPEVSRDEAVEMVRRIKEMEVSDRVRSYWIELLSVHYEADFHTMIYWPDEERTPEQIVERASLDPTQIPPGPEPSPEQRAVAEEFLTELARRRMVRFAGTVDQLVAPVARILVRDTPADERASQMIDRLTHDQLDVPVNDLEPDVDKMADVMAEVTA